MVAAGCHVAYSFVYVCFTSAHNFSVSIHDVYIIYLVGTVWLYSLFYTQLILAFFFFLNVDFL